MNILAVCVGSPERLPGTRHKTGINKHAIEGSVFVDREGLVGDAVCNKKHHGGVDQAVYLEGSITLDWWVAQLGHPIAPGTFGENLVIEGLDNRVVAVGDRFIAGDLVLEATAARIPCSTLAARMADPQFIVAYMRAARPGIYCRVIRYGWATAGEPVELRPFQGARVTMPEMIATFGTRLSAEDRDRYLAAPIHRKLRKILEAQS